MGKFLSHLIWPGGGAAGPENTPMVQAKWGNAYKKAHEAAKKNKGKKQTVDLDTGGKVEITVLKDGSTRVHHSDGRDHIVPKGGDISNF